MGHCGKLEAEASPKTGRGRWDNLVEPVRGRGLPDLGGQEKVRGSLTPQERHSMSVREI